MNNEGILSREKKEKPVNAITGFELKYMLIKTNALQLVD
jgi:hypothetical protein